MSKKTVVEFVDFLKPRLNRRSVAFLLCILLSALFWLLTSLSKEYIDEVIIPVEYENLPENLLIVNEPIAAVTAEVQGFGFDLLWHSLRFDKVQITVPANPSSLPSVKRGGEEIHFLLTQERTGKMSIGDEQLVVLKIYPDTLFIKFKPLFVKTVPVKLDADLSFAKQFGLISSPVVDPDTITVSGLQSEVEQIEFVATEHQSWTDLRESLTVEVPLNQIGNSRLVRYSHDQVQVAVNVTEFTEGSVSIPVNINADNPESVKVYPSEVEVKYQVPLADYDKITPEMFRASVQVEENRNDQLLVVQLDETPVQVRQTRVNPPHVEYIFAAMRVIGITGGIGSGKTTTCKIFEQLGVPVYYADVRAKELMTQEPLRSKIIQAFGENAYLNGQLNRTYLAKEVFNSKEKLSVLNGIVHPAVGDDFDEWLERQKAADYVLKEAAILFESGAYHAVDFTVLVIAPEDVRIDRVIKRDGISREDVMKRMKNQWTQERKAKLADHIVNNDGSKMLIPQVLELHKKFSKK